nr:MAGE-like protein 2 [Anser cygnoides]
MHRGIAVSWRCWARHPRPHCFGLGALDPIALGVLQVKKMQEGKPHPWTCRCALSVACPGQDFAAVLDGAGISGGDASVGRCRAPMEATTQLPARFCSLGAARGRPEMHRGSHVPPPGSPPGHLGGAAPATSMASGVCAPWPRGQSSNPWGLLLLRDPHPCCLPGDASREHHATRDTLGTPLSPCSPHHLLTHPTGRRSPLSQGTHRGVPITSCSTGSPAVRSAPPALHRSPLHPWDRFQLPPQIIWGLGTASPCPLSEAPRGGGAAPQELQLWFLGLLLAPVSRESPGDGSCWRWAQPGHLGQDERGTLGAQPPASLPITTRSPALTLPLLQAPPSS